ncbi:MAG TPA: ATP-binding protein [Pirellulales bacterium]|jgi:PAS domain S-box-containing protein|nr:ATP-binding protein [Pirellulales bacterium]
MIAHYFASALSLVVLLGLIGRWHRLEIAGWRRRADQHQAWFDACPDALLILDEQVAIARINDAAERMFGLPRAQVLGSGLSALVAPEPSVEPARDVRMLLLPPMQCRTQETKCTGRRADGTQFVMRIRSRRMDDGDRSWVIAALHDLSSEQRIKDALHRHVTQLVETKDVLQKHNQRLEGLVSERTAELSIAKDAAERANSTKSDFLANMSHELRTPLHAILSFARFGVQKVQTAERDKLAHYFARIAASGQTLLTLLNEVLDLSKLEAGAVTLNCQAVDMHDVVENICAELTAMVRERQLSLEAPSREQPAWVWGDPERLAQVLRNLVNNAIKFSPPGSSIELDVALSDESMTLAVRDHGPGIPDDECETVFDKFVQAKATATGAGGTGLGLTICRQLVALHRGTIHAEPTHGHGALVRVVLPRLKPALAEHSMPLSVATC